MRKCIDYIVHAAYVFRANRSVAIIESPLVTVPETGILELTAA